MLYEAAPLAFLAEQAGGCSSNGHQRIMELKPTGLHQCMPVIIGNRDLVEMAERFIQKG